MLHPILIQQRAAERYAQLQHEADVARSLAIRRTDAPPPSPRPALALCAAAAPTRPDPDPRATPRRSP
jgi:hypothetical protein